MDVELQIDWKFSRKCDWKTSGKLRKSSKIEQNWVKISQTGPDAKMAMHLLKNGFFNAKLSKYEGRGTIF